MDQCACTQIRLSQETLIFLQKTTFGCLCNACLLDIENLCREVEKWKDIPLTDLKEGVHYYMEDGNWVFTALYHVLKGYCCQNGCRHCVYGFSTAR
jgi:hypothetical protein